MKTSIFRRGISGLLAVLMTFTALMGIGTTTAFAASTAGETAESYSVGFPRDGDANLDYSGTWGHDELHYMNGWTSGEATWMTTLHTIGSFDGQACYCIEPGVPRLLGKTYSRHGEDYWKNYPSDCNSTIDADTIKTLLGRIMQYGYQGNLSTSWRSQNDADADKLAHMMATQALVWETVVGERDANFNHVDPGSADAVKSVYRTSHPLYSRFSAYYDSIEDSVQKHTIVPSFMARSTGKAQTVELNWDGSCYSATLTDTNGVLGNYRFSANQTGVSFSVQGNVLTISTQNAPILSFEADREAARETDRYEAEFGADGTRVFRETEDLAEDDSGIESLTDEKLDALPISTVKDGEVVTYPNAEALLDDQKESLAPPPQVKRPTKIVPHVLHPEINTEYRTNFQIESDDIGVGTPLERFYHNIRAIQLLNKLDAESRLATPTEQRVLADYVGWGGLSEFFKEDNPHYTELKAVLSDEEYASARESTLTAFYTPPVVIKAVYRALENMRFQTGNVLEPSCGIGNFMGLVPESMNDAKFYGVELDSISGRIAQQLYQKNSIAVQGFESTNLPDSFFDAAIGNVPFGQFKVPDKRYDKHNFLIHDYFFARTLDKVRPGGVIAFITSKGTLDKENPNVRKYIAQRADLLGAIRLPNDTFKAAAGTEVTSDIIFLQKRDRLVDIEPDWVHLATDANGIRMNAYFVDNPEMVLGDMQMVSGPHGMESACIAYENADLGELLQDSIQNIHAEITEYEIDDLEAEDEDLSIPADPDVRNFSFTVVDGKIYYRENSRMNPVDVSATAESRIKGMIAIRDCVRTLIEYAGKVYYHYRGQEGH